ncbi:MAG: cytochrome c biogenesis protein ResB [Bacteroidales bacterium]
MFIVSLGIALAFVAVLVSVYFFSNRLSILSWFYSKQASLISIGLLLILTLLLGLIRQDAGFMEESSDWLGRLGLRALTSSGLFLTFLLFFLSVLGLSVIHTLFTSLSRPNFNFPFLLNHLGLFITMLSLLMGGLSMERYSMRLVKNQPEWRVLKANGQEKQLPFAVELLDFDIEEYAPKLRVLDTRSGELLPVKHPVSMTIDPEQIYKASNGEAPAQTGVLLKWKVEVLQYMPQAMLTKDQYGPIYIPYKNEGAAPVAFVNATSLQDTSSMRQEQGAWVSCGSAFMQAQGLWLDSSSLLIMAPPEPKRFISSLQIYKQEEPEGGIKRAVLEVNHPIRVGNYSLYQASYDKQMGKWSPYIIIEVVKDPWQAGVLIGIVLLLLGLFLSFIPPFLWTKWRGYFKNSFKKLYFLFPQNHTK